MKHDTRYDDNTIDWMIGDKVIHTADAKSYFMMMVVTGYNKKENMIITKYVHPKHFGEMTGKFENDKKYLLDPKKFGL